MDDVLVALGALGALLLPPAAAVQLLAEVEGDAAPALVDEELLGALLHAPPLVLEPAARHAVAGGVGLEAAPQALLVAALAGIGARPVLAVNRTHCRRSREEALERSRRRRRSLE